MTTQAVPRADKRQEFGAGLQSHGGRSILGPDERPLNGRSPRLSTVNPADWALSQPLVDLIDKASPSVGRVNMYKVRNGKRQRAALGSCFLVSGESFPGAKGLPKIVLVTCFHCVDQVDALEVVFPGGKKLDFKPMGVNMVADCAVCEMVGEVPEFPTLSVLLDGGKVFMHKRGTLAVALGHPLGMQKEDADPSATFGRLSNRFPFDGPYGAAEDVHYMDTPINPGNSGGPLIDELGNVIGQNSWGMGNAESVGFAPSIRHPVELGASLQPGDRAFYAFDGALIVQSYCGSSNPGLNGPMIVAARPNSALAPFQASEPGKVPGRLMFGRFGDWLATRGEYAPATIRRMREAEREWHKDVRVPSIRGASIIREVNGQEIRSVQQLREVLSSSPRYSANIAKVRIEQLGGGSKGARSRCATLSNLRYDTNQL